MSVNDPIADMLTRIRNAVSTGQPLVAMPSSNLKAEIARILREEGFIESFELFEGQKVFERMLRVKLKYVGERRERRPVITGLVRVSRPGRRVYTHKYDVRFFYAGVYVGTEKKVSAPCPHDYLF